MVPQEDGRRYKIGQVARRLDISVETIRMYEHEGLIFPSRTETGQRYFDESDLHWLRCIRRLIKEKGLNIEGIRRLLALLPCWELRPCTDEMRDACPAFLGSARPCWAMQSKIPESCRSDDCRECGVYQAASQCDNLKLLVYRHLHRE